MHFAFQPWAGAAVAAAAATAAVAAVSTATTGAVATGAARSSAAAFAAAFCDTASESGIFLRTVRTGHRLTILMLVRWPKRLGTRRLADTGASG